MKLKIFFKTKKLAFYKKKILEVCNAKKIIDSKIVNLFLGEFKIFCTTTVLLNLQIINKDINNLSFNFFYWKIKRFASLLFVRRFNLFIDFIKILVLFAHNKISVTIFLSFLAQVFRRLPKRNHNRFLFFLKFLFQTLLKKDKNVSNVFGIKFIVAGRLLGKMRANSSRLQVGVVPIQSIDKYIEFSKLHVYTLYGAFGFKLWIYRKN